MRTIEHCFSPWKMHQTCFIPNCIKQVFFCPTTKYCELAFFVGLVNILFPLVTMFNEYYWL